MKVLYLESACTRFAGEIILHKKKFVNFFSCFSCRECLKNTIEFNDEVQVKCPFRDDLYACECKLQDREIKELAPLEIYERYLNKSVSVAEKNLDKSFHCKTVDCPGWCVYDDNVNVFNCPVCYNNNCINCQAIHTGVNCKQYQEELEFNSANDEDAKKTKEFVEVDTIILLSRRCGPIDAVCI